MPPPGYIPGVPNPVLGVPFALGSAILSSESDPRWESPGRPAFGVDHPQWGEYLQHISDHPENNDIELPDGRLMNLGEAIRDGWISPGDPNYNPQVAALPQFRPGAAGVYHGERRMPTPRTQVPSFGPRTAPASAAPAPRSQVAQAAQSLAARQAPSAHVNARRPTAEKQPDEEFEELPEAPTGATWDVLSRHQRFKRAQKLAHRGYDPLPSTIAPITELQKKARTKASLLADAKHDNYEVAEKEIKDASKKGGHKEVAPMLKEATRASTSPEDAKMVNHFDDIAKKMAQQMRMEGKDFYNREIAPKTNYAYIQSGLWNSPLRNKAQAHAWAEMEKGVQNQEAKMLWEAKHAGLAEAGHHKQRNLDAAKEAGSLIEREKENANVGAQNLAKIESQKGIHGALDLEMMNQMGKQHQAEEERGLLEDREQARAEQLHPHQQMAMQAAHEQGSTLPVEFPHARKEQPMAPNHAMNLAGVTALMAPHVLGNDQQKKYAAGGPVLPDVPMTPEMTYQMQLANEMRQPQANPHGAGFHELGAHLLASQGKNPYQAFGEGMQKYGEAVNKAKASHQDQRERAANIMQKIQASRLDQQQILMNYGHKEKELKESKRVNTANIASHNAHAKLFEAQAKQLEAPPTDSSRFVPKGMHESEEYKQHVKLNAKAQENANERKNAIAEAESTINSMRNAVKGGIGVTGPWLGKLGENVATGWDPEKLANRRVFESGNVKNLLKNMEKMKGTQSELDRITMERAELSFTDDPETIEKFLGMQEAYVARAKELEAMIDKDVESGIPQFEAEKRAHQWATKNPLFKAEEQKQEKQPEQQKYLATLEQKMKERGLPLS